MSTATAENKTKVVSKAPAKPQTAKEKTPKLVCNVTGIARYTNAAYLANKARSRGVNVETLLSNYVSRPVAKLLREGKTVTEVQSILGSTYDSPLANTSAEEILRLNGKQKKA